VLVSNASGNTFGATSVATRSGTNVPSALVDSNVISGNRTAGIEFTGSASGNQVLGSYIGVGSDGQVHAGLGNPIGVLLDNAGVNSIGGTATGAGNIITQSPLSTPTTAPVVGVSIVGPPSPASSSPPPAESGSMVIGNLIGLAPLTNSFAPASQNIGVLITNSAGNVIGGTGLANRNVMSGNSTAGLDISGIQSQNNEAEGNFIGTDPTGAFLIYGTGAVSSDDLGATITQKQQLPPQPPNFSALPAWQIHPSQNTGVLIDHASFNMVGTSASGQGNVISGNEIGVDIEGSAGDPTKGASNSVSGNDIGTNSSGTGAVPNFEYGVYISGSPKNSVSSNIISANGVAGIDIFGGVSQSSTAPNLGNMIINNLIGANLSGNAGFSTTSAGQMVNHPRILNPSQDGIPAHFLPAYLGFQLNGVVVIGSSGNTIGLPGNGNTITGNILTGVYLTSHDFEGNTYAQPFGNTIQSNTIVREGMYGVYLYDAPEATNPLVLQGSRANTITGSPIAIGQYVTGVSNLAPAQPNPQSILLPTGFGVPMNPFQSSTSGSGSGTKQVTPGGKHKPPPKVRHKAPKPTRRIVNKPVRHTHPHQVLHATKANSLISRPKVPELLHPGARLVQVRHPSIKAGK